ncbi:hypothetical protein SAMN05216593_103412 [Pseudomonas asturiensis]|uniref:Uncharacterized protein n=1 Tax=Pseudomonas asturiensis TaxID=1190415 RepID=A0A1M7LYL1_9PSED|nr:hypothetical protein SAMN05216593_103412 [Pseudomonas asturiensis]
MKHLNAHHNALSVTRPSFMQRCWRVHQKHTLLLPSQHHGGGIYPKTAQPGNNFAVTRYPEREHRLGERISDKKNSYQKQ